MRSVCWFYCSLLCAKEAPAEGATVLFCWCHTIPVRRQSPAARSRPLKPLYQAKQGLNNCCTQTMFLPLWHTARHVPFMGGIGAVSAATVCAGVWPRLLQYSPPEPVELLAKLDNQLLQASSTLTAWAVKNDVRGILAGSVGVLSSHTVQRMRGVLVIYIFCFRYSLAASSLPLNTLKMLRCS